MNHQLVFLDATSSYLHMTGSWEHESFTFCLFNVIFNLCGFETYCKSEIAVSKLSACFFRRESRIIFSLPSDQRQQIVHEKSGLPPNGSEKGARVCSLFIQSSLLPFTCTDCKAMKLCAIISVFI